MHYDTTRFVAASMHDVVITLAEALALVVAVVFVFLQSWRTTIIPTIAIPVSLIATLAVMEICGFSLNMLSLLGMVLAIGLVVDDAIVVVENVERQLEAGLSPMAATRKAMSEVTGPIIATTAVLMAVFIPVAFIPGVAGRLYNQFALTVAISVGISAFNSLTLSPALAAVFLRHRPNRPFILFRWFNAGFDWLSHAYARLVGGFIRARWALMIVFALGLGGTYMLWTRLPSTFLPVEDQGYFFVVIQGPDGASLERTDAVAKQVRDVLQATPGVDIVGSISGLNFLTNAAQSNSAVEFAILKPWDERPPEQNASAIVAAVRPEAAVDPERLRAQLRSALDPGPRHHGRLRVRGRGPDGTRQRGAQRGHPGRAGGGAQAARTQRPADVLVLLHLDAAVQLRPRPQQGEAAGPQPAGCVQHAADLSRLALRERLQPVRPHVSRDAAGRQGGARQCGRPVAALCAQCLGRHGAALDAGHAEADRRAGDGAALQQLRVGADQRRRRRPASARARRSRPCSGPPRRRCRATSPTNGPASPSRSSRPGSAASLIFGLAIVFVFLILAAQYESWTMPFMVLLAVPLALFGALAALTIRQMQIDVYSQIGFVMLIGLAAKNAILIVEFARRLREDGASIAEAAMEAGRLRLRPILMTAFAFILGVLPLVIATGAGAASRRSLGTTVFGGMVAATVLTLIFVPVFYAIIERAREGRHADEVGADHHAPKPEAYAAEPHAQAAE